MKCLPDDIASSLEEFLKKSWAIHLTAFYKNKREISDKWGTDNRRKARRTLRICPSPIRKTQYPSFIFRDTGGSDGSVFL